MPIVIWTVCEDEFERKLELEMELECKYIGCWNDLSESWSVRYGIKTYKGPFFFNFCFLFISLEFIYYYNISINTRVHKRNSRYYEIILFYLLI